MIILPHRRTAFRAAGLQIAEGDYYFVIRWVSGSGNFYQYGDTDGGALYDSWWTSTGTWGAQVWRMGYKITVDSVVIDEGFQDEPMVSIKTTTDRKLAIQFTVGAEEGGTLEQIETYAREQLSQDVVVSGQVYAKVGTNQPDTGTLIATATNVTLLADTGLAYVPFTGWA